MEAEERIDLYLQGKLEGKDLDIFRLRLQQDDVFAEEVETRRLIVEAIKAARHEELKFYIQDAIKLETKVVAFPLRKIVFAAAAIILFGVVWLVFEKVINLKDNSETITIDQKDQTKESKQEIARVDDMENSAKKVDTAMIPPVAEIDSQNQSYVFDDNSSDLPILTEPESEVIADERNLDAEITAEVKKDRLIEKRISSEYFNHEFLNANDSLKKQETKPSVAEITKVEKTKIKDQTGNKQDVSVKEDLGKPAVRNFDIELWESIVNFKGYKWDGKKLLLYGIDPSENIEFHWLSTKLVLQRGTDYFLLNQTSRFESYLKLTDQNLLDKLLK